LSSAIQLGPLLLPFALLLVFASAGSTLALGKWLSRSSAEVDKALWHALLAGVVLARLAFVYEYRSLYLASPLTMLDIRDGGWNPTFGLVGAWMFALTGSAGRRPSEGRCAGRLPWAPPYSSSARAFWRFKAAVVRSCPNLRLTRLMARPSN
jgi:prolipoprotein diacylglyceryltransferase